MGFALSTKANRYSVTQVSSHQREYFLGVLTMDDDLIALPDGTALV
jgi:hypothetical protein